MHWKRAGPQGMSVLTRAMRDDSGPSDFADPFLFNQPQHRMECASDLERPDLLEVLCFEEQLDLRLSGSWPSHGVAFSASGLWGADARFESVVLVSTGVVWMWGLMRACAATIDLRVNGRSMVDMVGSWVVRAGA